MATYPSTVPVVIHGADGSSTVIGTATVVEDKENMNVDITVTFDSSDGAVIADLIQRGNITGFSADNLLS